MASGRPKGMVNLSIKEEYELVCRYVECGNYAQIARETGRQRETITKAVKRWILEHPEDYQKMLDAFLMRNKQELIFRNTHITNKALDKVNVMLDDPDACKSVKDVAMTYGILYDKGALMKGESTSNSAVIIKLPDSLKDLAK